jgi:hypothetical protein
MVKLVLLVQVDKTLVVEEVVLVTMPVPQELIVDLVVRVL